MPVSAIAVAKPFLPTLATYIASRLQQDKSFSRGLILLPTRRACRSLQELLLENSSSGALLLPQILPIGDITEATAISDITAAVARANLPPAISPMQRLLLLTQLISKQYEESKQSAYNFIQSVHLAQELAALFDELERQRFPLQELRNLVPEDYSKHWQLTLDFLSIYLDNWPRILSSKGAVDVLQRRNLVMDAVARHWSQNPPDYPIVIAGSTASNTSTRDFIRIAAAFPNTHVILPGLDPHMDAASWDAINHTHPQYHLRALLETLKLSRSEIPVLGEEGDKARHAWLSQALLPPDMTHKWQTTANAQTGLQGLHELPCNDAQQEAEIIALVAKKHRAESNQSVCIVTEDRQLAKRIQIACKALGLSMDDSSGNVISDSPAAVFLMLLIDAAEENSLLKLLALFQHPLATAGFERSEILSTARWIDYHLMRHPHAEHVPPSISDLARLRDIPANVLHVVATWSDLLEPLRLLLRKHTANFAEILNTHLQLAMRASAQTETLWVSESGKALHDYVNELIAHADRMFVDPAAYRGMLEEMLRHKTIWLPYNTQAKVRLLSPMEARLETADVMILAGLCEGVWPRHEEPSPWLSRAMQQKLGMDSPEANISRTAHDFVMLLHAPDVYFTYSHTVDGQIMEPSRWLQRIHSYLSTKPGMQLDTCPEIFGWWQYMHQYKTVPLDTQIPAPPIHSRPREFSISDMEMLQRDPYAIYAKHILKLRPLEMWDREAEASHFGDVVHHAIEDFTNLHPKQLPADALAQLLAIGYRKLAELGLNPLTLKCWQQRFEVIAEWIIEQEMQRRTTLAELRAEQKLRVLLKVGGQEFSLKGRIDRLEKGKTGAACLIDYKTGALPPVRDITSGVACQLPLEAWLLEKQESGSTVEALEYWKLSGRRGQSEIKPAGNKQFDAIALKEKAGLRVQELLEHYLQPQSGYPICPNPRYAPKYNDYAHLERIGEVEAEEEGQD